MKGFILGVLLFSNTLLLVAQPDNKTTCPLMRDIVETPLFKNFFSIEKNLDRCFVLVDKKGVITDCDTGQNGSYRIINSDTGYFEPSEIVINVGVGYKFEGRLISVVFWSPKDGSALTVHYELEINGYHFLGYKTGYF